MNEYNKRETDSQIQRASGWWWGGGQDKGVGLRDTNCYI